MLVRTLPTLQKFLLEIRFKRGESQRALASKIGLKSQSALLKWAAGVKRVPAIYCQRIVEATEGAVTLYDLRPDDWWMHWDDPIDGKQGIPAPSRLGDCLDEWRKLWPDHMPALSEEAGA